MGTRADFYIGRGTDAEWLGSIAWDGYPDGVPIYVRDAESEDEFRKVVFAFLAMRNDASGPEHGWPWPWDDSNTTDFSYAWDLGCVWVTCFGHGWDRCSAYDPDDERERPKLEFPDMAPFRHVAPAESPRSGLTVVSIPPTHQ